MEELLVDNKFEFMIEVSSLETYKQRNYQIQKEISNLIYEMTADEFHNFIDLYYSVYRPEERQNESYRLKLEKLATKTLSVLAFLIGLYPSFEHFPREHSQADRFFLMSQISAKKRIQSSLI